MPVFSSGHPAREYSHPVDASITKVMDTPVINMIFKSFVSAATDAQFGQVIATGVPVNRMNFPEIDDIVDQCVRTLHIKKPYVIISGSLGINAYTVGSDEEPYIVLGNTLVRIIKPDQLRFIIGHECGHIAMGHVVYHTVLNTANGFSNSIPVIGPLVFKTVGVALYAWSRRSEITADRAGLLCCGSLQTAQRALLQLETGFISADHVDLQSYLESSRRYRNGRLLRKVGEFDAEHPLLAKRIEALKLFAGSDLYGRVTGQPTMTDSVDDHQLEHAVEQILRVA